MINNFNKSESGKILKQITFYILDAIKNFIFVLIFIAVIFVTVLYFDSGIRKFAFRSLSELPSISIHFLIRPAIISANFKSAAIWLQRELDIIRWIRSEKSSLLPGLIKNTGAVMRRVAIPKDLVILKPFLTQLAKAAPDMYLTRVWLARALADTDPKAALKELSEAVKLSGTDPESYRLAISIAVRHGLRTELQSWCNHYQTNQFGGIRPYETNNQFMATGIRRMALEVRTQNKEIVFYGHKGLSLNALKTYAFGFDRQLKISRLFLKLGLSPGVILKIDGLSLFNQGREVHIPSSDMVILSKNGFHVRDTLLVAGEDGDALEFVLRGRTFPLADSAAIRMSAVRAGLTASNICHSVKTKEQ